MGRRPAEGRTERDARTIADVAPGVHTPESAAFLLKHLGQYAEPRAVVVNSVRHIARYRRSGNLEIAAGVRPPSTRRTSVCKPICSRRSAAAPEERGASLDDDARGWASELVGKLLASKQPPDVKAGAELAGQFKLEKEEAKVSPLAADRAGAAGEPRGGPWGAMAIDAAKNASVTGGVLADADAPIELREAAAKLLGQANKPETQAQLLQALPSAPARLQTVIAAGLAASKEGGEKLLEAVAPVRPPPGCSRRRRSRRRCWEARSRILKTVWRS